MSSIDDAVTAVKNIVIAINNLAKTLSSSFASLTGNNAFTGTNTFLNTVTMTGAAFNEAFATIASAATTNIGAAAGNYLQVTGVTTITAFGTVQAGTERTLEFAGILTLTHNATSLILPGGASIVTAAGDTAIFRSEGSGNWRCISYSPAAGPLTGMRNRLINGDMRIDQRNVGATAALSGSNTYTVDRWYGLLTGGTIEVASVNRGASTVPGFLFAAYYNVTVANAAPSPGATFQWGQPIEGQNIADLAWGTANAKAVTVSFWATVTTAGTYAGAIVNNAGARSYVFQYTIAVGNTAQFFTTTIPGDTTGTWLTDTGVGLYLFFDLGCGSTYEAAAANVWSAGNFRRIAGNSRFTAAAASPRAVITGVQLEAEPFATAFERRQFGTELLLCQRYFRKSYPQSIAPGTAGATASELINYSFSANGWIISFLLSPTMRTSPTVTTYSPVTGTAGQARNDNLAADVATTNQSSETDVIIAATATGAQQQITVHFGATAEL